MQLNLNSKTCVEFHIRHRSILFFKTTMKSKWIWVIVFSQIIFCPKSFSQIYCLPKNISKSDAAHFADSIRLKNKFKSIGLPDIESSIIVAFNQYPEFKQSQFIFHPRKINFTMSCRPTFASIFRKPAKRKYVITMNKSEKKAGLVATQLSTNAQIGVFGHEMSHAVRFSHQSSFRICWESLRYLFPKFRRQYEIETDKMAIARGFGWQILEFDEFVATNPKVPKKYLEKKRKFYLNADEIKRLIKCK